MCRVGGPGPIRWFEFKHGAGREERGRGREPSGLVCIVYGEFDDFLHALFGLAESVQLHTR